MDGYSGWSYNLFSGNWLLVELRCAAVRLRHAVEGQVCAATELRCAGCTAETCSRGAIMCCYRAALCCQVAVL